jgi:hypothetical protein
LPKRWGDPTATKATTKKARQAGRTQVERRSRVALALRQLCNSGSLTPRFGLYAVACKRWLGLSELDRLAM